MTLTWPQHQIHQAQYPWGDYFSINRVRSINPSIKLSSWVTCGAHCHNSSSSKTYAHSHTYSEHGWLCCTVVVQGIQRRFKLECWLCLFVVYLYTCPWFSSHTFTQRTFPFEWAKHTQAGTVVRAYYCGWFWAPSSVTACPAVARLVTEIVYRAMCVWNENAAVKINQLSNSPATLVYSIIY